MTIVNLIAALALTSGLWVVIAKALGASIRRAERRDAAVLETPESAPAPRPWYAPPANRPWYAPPTHPEVANPRIVDRLSVMKDLHA